MNLENMALNNEKALGENSYPGRGIVVGMTPDGENYVQIYWIMGRSENSRNRIFELEGNFVKTKAFDPAKLEDPSLIIYYPVKDIKGIHIVTNGDQTDTIYNYLQEGKSFENALNTRKFEPDAPNFTPRISAFIRCSQEQATYGLSILKTIDNKGDICVRSYFNYDKFTKGYGHCIHTYKSDGNPIPSFVGEPFVVKLANDIEENADHFWTLLNDDNKISLLVKYISVKDNRVKFKIINKKK